ncbi:uncharacterized protein LAJ45_01789 [Morchella importuna]|uniref:uncharacterized protein n=1 Tax=Morchella importuna TaxID=1174673 RepID=UPI001E8E6041|nr:uncharacterized protein LAJ45_01789 [Morchella importuna]KAH8154022.1 hypothetical protein LAJ45_01789 [Morchella importuna]
MLTRVQLPSKHSSNNPSSSGGFSPKIEQLQTSYTYTQPSSPSPNTQEFSYDPYSHYSPSSNEVSYGYGYVPPQVSSPANTSTYLQPLSPSQDSYQVYNYNRYQQQQQQYQQQQPSLPPANDGGSAQKYSGYPPASAFYGPSPNMVAGRSTASSSSSSHQSHYRRRSSARKSPEEYTFETWYTADGRKVEYSPMHMNCATM